MIFPPVNKRETANGAGQNVGFWGGAGDKLVGGRHICISVRRRLSATQGLVLMRVILILLNKDYMNTGGQH